MGASLGDLLTALKNGVTAINNLSTQLRDTFPPITDLSTSAPAVGTIAYSSLAVAFGSVQSSSGGSYRIALLASS